MIFYIYKFLPSPFRYFACRESIHLHAYVDVHSESKAIQQINFFLIIHSQLTKSKQSEK